MNYLELSYDQITSLLQSIVPTLRISPSKVTITPFSIITPNTALNQTQSIGNVGSGVGQPDSKTFYLGTVSGSDSTRYTSTGYLKFYFNDKCVAYFGRINKGSTTANATNSTGGFNLNLLFTGIISSGSNDLNTSGSPTTSNQQVPLFSFVGLKIQINT